MTNTICIEVIQLNESEIGWITRKLKSLALMVTFPLVILRILKPTVGIMSSVNWPLCKKIAKVYAEVAKLQKKHEPLETQNSWIIKFSTKTNNRCFVIRDIWDNNLGMLTAMTLTKVVFPEFWRPTRVNSISSFQKRLRIQSSTRLIMDNIVELERSAMKPDKTH